MLSSYNYANDYTYIEPGKKYENKLDRSVFLVLELEPGEQFENVTNQVFQVFKSQDFFKKNYQFNLELAIDQHQNNIAAKKQGISQVEDRIKAKNQEKIAVEKGER